MMGMRCLLNGVEVNYPCSSVCELFGDCVTAFNEQKKANVRTNADRIRAMSDEELAEGLEDWQDWGGGLSKEMWLEWLKEPAEQ